MREKRESQIWSRKGGRGMARKTSKGFQEGTSLADQRFNNCVIRGNVKS